jgi:8-oxo-dGTP pyrophosphatase MutT (NUDIX family)
MGYIHELRQLVGKRPLIMAGAALLALNAQNQLLMIKRTDNGCWGVPGGAMELGEDLQETAKRETKEEIGVEAGDIELFGVYSGQELFYRYPNGAEVYNVTAVYLTRSLIGEIEVNPDEHSQYRYFDLQDLPAEISPPIQPILRDLVSKYNKS